MLAASTNAGPAASHPWHSSDLGQREQWPPVLRAAVDIVLAAPSPMLLVWGPRRVTIFNSAYAELAGIFHGQPPGGKVPALNPPPIAAAAQAFEDAASGHYVQLARQRLTVFRSNGPTQLEVDMTLTPLPGADGHAGGVLCMLAISPERIPESRPEGLRVLVVEDNLDSQYLVCEMLKAFGHHADGIAHGEGALDMLGKARYDVLFSDVSLPGMSGVELARQALERDPRMHVIFASGYGEALLKHLTFPFQSLQKPYEIDQLQTALARIGSS